MRVQPEGAHGEPDVVHRYVAGKLSPGEIAAFEQHMLGCAHCQTAVREGSVIRSALLMAPAGGSAARPAWRRILVWGMPLAAAAVVVIRHAARDDPARGLGRPHPAISLADELLAMAEGRPLPSEAGT